MVRASMRIGMVSTEVAGYRGGGIGTHVVEAATALTGAGHECWLFTAPLEGEAGAALRRHPSFARVEFVGEGLPPDQRLPYRISNHAVEHATRVHYQVLAAGVPFDYIEVADFGAEASVLIAEQRMFRTHGDAVVALVLHSPSEVCYRFNRQSHWRTPAVQEVIALEHQAIRHAPVLLSPSRRLGDMVAERLDLDRGRIGELRPPMRPVAQPPDPPAAAAALADLDFVFFGRLEPRKGLTTLLDAFAQLPELRLDIIGPDSTGGPFADSYAAHLAARLPANVTLRQPLARDAMLQRIAQADVCVLPSPWDNWPNTCVEAMAHRRVVLGGRNGGMAEMIEPGVSGFLFDGGDAGDLVRCIRDELGSALDRLSAIGNAAQRRIRALTEPKRYVHAVETIVRGNRSDRAPAAVQAPPAIALVVTDQGRPREALQTTLASVAALRAPPADVVIACRPQHESLARGARMRTLTGAWPTRAAARNDAVAETKADLVVFLHAGDLVVPECLAVLTDVAQRFPAAALLAAQSHVLHAGTLHGVLNPIPIEPGTEISAYQFAHRAIAVRRSAWQDHGLCFDARIDRYCEWGLRLDARRAGLVEEIVPRILFHHEQPEEPTEREAALREHLSLLGLLVEHHMDTTEAERARLTAAIHAWGLGALHVAFAPDLVAMQDPLERLHDVLAREADEDGARRWRLPWSRRR